MSAIPNEAESKKPAAGKPAIVATNSWAGRIEHPCRVIGETSKRYRIEVDVETRLPRRTLAAGDRAMVPKSAVRLLGEGRSD